MTFKSHIIYFICLYKLWKEKTLLSYQNIIKSSILDDSHTTKMYIIASGEKTYFDELKQIWKHPKIEFIFYSENIKLHEYPGIEMVKKISINNPQDKIFYFHSKGITRKNAAEIFI